MYEIKQAAVYFFVFNRGYVVLTLLGNNKMD